MTDEDSRELTSWKEIAAHLDVTVRTAQLWEQQRGLPVRRMPGGRSRVYLRLDEYEAWLLGEASGNDHEGRNRWAFGATIAIAGVILGALIAWLLVFNGPFTPTEVFGQAPPISTAAIPTQAQVSADTLFVKNDAGDVLWTKQFSEGLRPERYLKPYVWFVDVDGDHRVEVLFARQTGPRTSSDELICYSIEGEELWRFTVGAEVERADRKFENVFELETVLAEDLGDGRRVVVLSSSHTIDEPSQIALLFPDGSLMSQYMHSGHLGHTSSSLRLADLDGNGVKEIYAGGISNARGRATLVILDPDTMAGTSEEPDGYQLLGLETGTEMARLFFPRSSMNVASAPYNTVATVHPVGPMIRVSARELFDGPQPSIIYELGPGFSLRHVSFSDVFSSFHGQLLGRGAVETTLDEEMQYLWEQGVEVISQAGFVLSAEARQ